MHRRRVVTALVVSSGWWLAGPVQPAIVAAMPSTVRIRHRLADDALFALVGGRLTTLDRSAPLHADFRRLLGPRHAAFIAGLGDEVPMRRIGDVVLGEGVRPGSLGSDASLFALARGGGLFAVIKGGKFGADIEQFGNLAILGRGDARHRYLEFVDLDE